MKISARPKFFGGQKESVEYPDWKFQDFSVFQILHEINFEDSKSAKSAILTQLEALNFDFYDFLHVLNTEIDQRIKIQRLQICKKWHA